MGRRESDTIKVDWIKLSVDMFDNRKIKAIRKLPAGNDILLIWIMLLTLAGKCNANGLIFLTENIPYNVKMLADELGFEESTVQLALEAFQNFGMIRTDGFISIEGWEEHQNADKLAEIREYNRIAKQKSRERQRQKQLQAVTNVNDMSSESQGFLLTSISTSISPSSDIEDSKEEGVKGGEEKEEPVISIPLNDDTEYPIYQEYVDKMQALYPAVDVMQEFRNMVGWSLNNKKKRKTKSGVTRFINSWLAGEQNKGGYKRNGSVGYYGNGAQGARKIPELDNIHIDIC